ncbi:hypothetical protein [Chroococcidiopsis sp. TS-821]|uniref:hypothetical protein n=1 Tax=Chroococcidiopsis sp. TS-821 TaxID=1378066 RepID=UPI000CEE166A|nr:hypothetical protein [Chroococcidiopsis sp. TS-821]PPS44878.1 hypothetical protein B1A85_00910 [Chroococcidiopsis sp. TS-821]
MISDEYLAREFTTVVSRVYPKTGELLRHCYVKVINSYWGKPPRRLQYVGIYCSERMIKAVQTQKDVLTEVAKDMGLVEVVCLNATRLLRDPMSKLKRTAPRFWLELYWVATQDP